MPAGGWVPAARTVTDWPTASLRLWGLGAIVAQPSGSPTDTTHERAELVPMAGLSELSRKVSL